jgi:hypothetical protein
MLETEYVLMAHVKEKKIDKIVITKCKGTPCETKVYLRWQLISKKQLVIISSLLNSITFNVFTWNSMYGTVAAIIM